MACTQVWNCVPVVMYANNSTAKGLGEAVYIFLQPSMAMVVSNLYQSEKR